MKRYFAASGLILASIIYFFTQHSSGEEQHQVVPPEGIGNIASGTTDTNGAPFGNPVTASNNSPAPTPAKSTSHAPVSSGSYASQGQYKNGTYTGSVADAYYGYVQVEAVVSGGKLADVKILQYPNDRSTSRYINSQALPYLVQEAVQAQGSHVNTISGASDTSAAFRQSLSSALAKA